MIDITKREPRTLKEYNQSRLYNADILSGQEYRRLKRKNKSKN